MTSATQERPKFENDRKVAEHELTHKGEIIFTGTVDQCYMKLQQVQSQSAHWATTYEGWKVEPTGNEIDDPKITVTVLKDVNWLNSVVPFTYRGKVYHIRRDAVYGQGSFTAGQTVDVDSHYAREGE